MKGHETIVLQHRDWVKLVVGDTLYNLIEEEGHLKIMLSEKAGKICFPIHVVPHSSNVIILE
jgi:hypothetical protein